MLRRACIVEYGQVNAGDVAAMTVDVLDTSDAS
jgi:hypothetical protein